MAVVAQPIIDTRLYLVSVPGSKIRSTVAISSLSPKIYCPFSASHICTLFSRRFVPASTMVEKSIRRDQFVSKTSSRCDRDQPLSFKSA